MGRGAVAAGASVGALAAASMLPVVLPVAGAVGAGLAVRRYRRTRSLNRPPKGLDPGAFSKMEALRGKGIDVLAVGRSEAATLVFPPGHPRDGVVYVGDPVSAELYYPGADFHRRAFEHKFSDALNLLMALAATRISVQSEEGWGRDFATSLALPLPDLVANLRGGAHGRASHESKLLFEARLSPRHPPRLPKGLTWFTHEPTWRATANARLTHGLEHFTLSVRYTDDYGVNADLEAKVAAVGLDLGGEFNQYRATTWRMEGDFASFGPERVE
jgi:hypothetical protein